jgi:hypothetical protein
VGLTAGDFQLLRELVTCPFQVLYRQRLTGVLREPAPSHGGGATPWPRARGHANLEAVREAAAAGYDCIKTMRFVGYRFVLE